VIFTVDKGYCGSDDVNYKQRVDVALKTCNFKALVFVTERSETKVNSEVNMRDKTDFWLEKVRKRRVSVVWFYSADLFGCSVSFSQCRTYIDRNLSQNNEKKEKKAITMINGL